MVQTRPPTYGGYKRKIKREFYQDFMDIYWSDEYDNGCSDNASYHKNNFDVRIERDIMEERKMISRKIKIDRVSDIKRFVDKGTKYGDSLILKGINYEFPACSLMSVMSLVDLSQSVKMMFSDDLLDNVLEDFAEWII